MMRLNQFVSVVAITWVAPAFATGSLTFSGNGFVIDMTVRFENGQVLNPVRIGLPGHSDPISLDKSEFKAFKCDLRRKRFHAIFLGAAIPNAPKHFEVKVSSSRGIFLVDGKRISFKPDWRIG